jgi:hypothetical protein
MIYFDYYITRLDTIRRGERGKVRYYSSTILLLSPFPFSVSDYKKDEGKLLPSMSKELVLQQQILQTEREPSEIETEIECPRCYDIMAQCYDFDKLYYLCEECNLSILIN